MVVIRLARRGAKKQPFYHITAADQRAPRDGKYIEKLGYYNPIARGNAQRLYVDLDRVDYWLGVGAQTTETARRLLKEARIQAENPVEEPEAIEETADATSADESTEVAETTATDAEEIAAETVEEVAESSDASTDEADASSEEQLEATESSEDAQVDSESR